MDEFPPTRLGSPTPIGAAPSSACLDDRKELGMQLVDLAKEEYLAALDAEEKESASVGRQKRGRLERDNNLLFGLFLDPEWMKGVAAAAAQVIH